MSAAASTKLEVASIERRVAETFRSTYPSIKLNHVGLPSQHHPDYIEVRFSGPVPELLRCGLMCPEMIQALPPKGNKNFYAAESKPFGYTSVVIVARNKGGYRIATYFDAVDAEASPSWIAPFLAELREHLKALDEEKDAPRSLSPDAWRAEMQSLLCAFSTIGKGFMRKLEGADLDSDFRVNPDDLAALEQAATRAAQNLELKFETLRIEAIERTPRVLPSYLRVVK